MEAVHIPHIIAGQGLLMFKASRLLSLVDLVHIVPATIAHGIRIVGRHKSRNGTGGPGIPLVLVDVQLLQFLVDIIVAIIFGGGFGATARVHQRCLWSTIDDFFGSEMEA